MRIIILFWLSRKFILSPRLPTAVNLITIISIIGICLCTAAMVMVLSVFNGFETLMQELFAKIDADIQLTPRNGKYLEYPIFQKDLQQDFIQYHTPIFENRALVQYQDKQVMVVLRGVNNQYQLVSRYQEAVYDGKKQLNSAGEFPTVLLGAGVAYQLAANLEDKLHPLKLFTISENADLLTNPEAALQQINTFPAGYFSIQKEYDDQLVLAPLSVVHSLFQVDTSLATTIEIRLKPGINPLKAKLKLQQIIGSKAIARTSIEQHETIYLVMRNEKQIAFLVILLMLIIAAFNLVSSLTMTIISKKREIAVLQTVGANQIAIQKLFLCLGLLISGIGSLTGIGLGSTLVVLQDKYKLLKLNGGETFLLDAFPATLQSLDLVQIMGTVIVITLIASYWPAKQAAKRLIIENLQYR